MWPIVGPADRSLEVLGLGAFQGQALEHLSLSTLSVSVALQGIKWQGVDMWPDAMCSGCLMYPCFSVAPSA